MNQEAQPIPEGFHTLTPHLIVQDASEAIEFYKRAFSAEEIVRMPGPDGSSVMHAELKIGDSIIMLASENPEWGTKGPQALGGTPVTLHLYVENVDTAFDQAISAGATEKMPVDDTFWGDRYGQVADPFGHTWSIATHTQDLTPEEINAGAQEFFAKMAEEGHCAGSPEEG